MKRSRHETKVQSAGSVRRLRRRPSLKKKRSSPASAQSAPQQHAESPNSDVIALDISDTPEFVALLGYDPRLFEGTDSLTLLCRPGKKPDEPKRATAEQIFFGAMARARDERLKTRGTKSAKPKKRLRRRAH